MNETKRLFVAVKIIGDPDFIGKFNCLKQDLNHEKIRWVNENNLHLTLKFFGEISIEKTDKINEALKNSITNFEAFKIKINDIGIFGSYYNPKVIWANIDDSGALLNLEKIINKNLGAIGFHKTRENFRPHLTLGRLKKLRDKKLFQEIISSYKNQFYQFSTIEKVYLLESILQKKGAIYHVINEFKLKA